MTAALHAAGTLRQGSVATLTVTERLQTTVSNLWCLAATYTENASPTLPRHLMLKWALEASPAPERGEPELTFYRELAPALNSPPMVRCLATAAKTSAVQWLMLEDLRSTHTHPPWPERPSDNEVQAAVTVLAKLHARWWESHQLGATVGGFHTEASLTTMVHGIKVHVPGFLADLGSALPVADQVLLKRLFDSPLRPWLRLVDRTALTVIHGDAHTWNFLFPRHGPGVPYLIEDLPAVRCTSLRDWSRMLRQMLRKQSCSRSSDVLHRNAG